MPPPKVDLSEGVTEQLAEARPGQENGAPLGFPSRAFRSRGGSTYALVAWPLNLIIRITIIIFVVQVLTIKEAPLQFVQDISLAP